MGSLFCPSGDGGKYLPGAEPASRHTYGTLQCIPSQNTMLSFGGAVSNGGFSSYELWALDMGTAAWTLASPYGKVPGGIPTTAYNPNNGHVVMTDNNTGLYDFDPGSGTYKVLGSSVNLGGTYRSSAAIDPVHNFFVVISTGGGSAPAYDYFPGTATIRLFVRLICRELTNTSPMSGMTRAATFLTRTADCNGILRLVCWWGIPVAAIRYFS